MKIVHITHPNLNDETIQVEKVLALGFFDGVHLAHQEVIKTAKVEANRRGLPLAVMTFNQHPKIIYGRIDPKTYKYVSILERKYELMEALDVDILYVVNYTYDFGHQPPQVFVDNYIVGFKAQVVVAGYDYTYGIPQVANMKTLPEHAAGRFDIIEVGQLVSHNQKVGTTTIKDYLEAGQVELANEDLGYIYQNQGMVIHGKKVGRTIGFPTANIQIEHPQLIPGVGVYAVKVLVGDEWHLGAASIGYNITLYDDYGLSVEVYILDFDKYIYGETIRVAWHHRLRDELKFDGLDGLIEQLKKDERDTQEYFDKLETEE